MNLLNQITIRSRLIINVGILIIFFIIFGLFLLNEIKELGKITSILYEHPLRVSNRALRIRNAITFIHSNMKNFFLATAETHKSEATHNINDAENRIFDHLDVIRDQILGKEGKLLEKETRTLFTNWKPLRNKIIELIIQEKQEEALFILKNECSIYANQLDDKAVEISLYARNKADHFIAEAMKIQKRVINLSFSIIACFALLSLIITYLTISSILSSISSLKDTMSQITKTGTLTESNIEGNSEITVMAKHFNLLISELKNQFWLREGLNELNKKLSGNLTFSEIMDKSISIIARNTNACIGAIYIYDKQTSTCYLKSSFAFIKRKYISNQFKDGEGIIGQVAVEKKAILLTNITNDEAAGVTGTFSNPPKSIYSVPLFYQNDLQGIVELAFFENPHKSIIEFIDQASQIIATSIYTVQQKESIQNLLDTTQHKNKEIAKANEELQALNEELEAQTSELEAQKDELQFQKDKIEEQSIRIEEAGRLKSEFLSNMSHELRTPLNSILALSQLMTSRGIGKNPKKDSEYLQTIERNGKHLLSLINDILDLSKIESGKMDIYITNFQASEIVNQVTETMQYLADKKNLTISTQIQEDLTITNDKYKVHQILLNLVSNAVKFTNQGSIKISVTNDEEFILYTVQDTGIGIHEDDISYIFDEFRQIDGSTTRAHEGTGLGLAICNKLAVLLGGKISVNSVIGKGSTFTLKIPIKPIDPNSYTTAHNVEYNITQESKLSDKTILIIDDDIDSCDLMKEFLNSVDYNVFAAHRGKEGLSLSKSLASTTNLTAIILDILIPEMDGWEILQELKQDKTTADIPVIIVSMIDDKPTGIALGASGYVDKPIDKNKLIAEIKKAEKTLINNDIDILNNDIQQPVIIDRNNINKPPHILIVEDNEIAALQVYSALQEAQYTVTVASGGAQAIEIIEKQMPNLIVLDLMMPDIDGFQLLEKINSFPDSSDIPVLILTAKELTLEDRKKLSSDNIKQLIQKGTVNKQQLIESVKKIVYHKQKSHNQYPCIKKKHDAKTILIVEDNPDNLFTIQAILENEQYNLVSASDGIEAIEYAQEHHPDLILMDIQLPHISGLEAARNLRSHPKCKTIPIIAITAKAMKGDRIEVIDAGCNDYISKPINPEKLVKIVKKWIVA